MSTIKRWLLIIGSIVFITGLLLGLSIYFFNLTTTINFGLVATSIISIFLVAFLGAGHVAHGRSQVLSRTIKIDTNIKPDLIKGLVITTETQSSSTTGSVTKIEKQIRLSEIEIDHIANLFRNEVTKEVRKNFKAINDEFLTFYLFLFFVVGIVLFVIVIVLLFLVFKLQFQFVLTCLFDGICGK
jgi:hypothetical protein